MKAKAEGFGISETGSGAAGLFARPRLKTGALHLTERDQAILEFIGSGGLASLTQLKRKFWPLSKTEATCRQRLYHLERALYLKANFSPLPGRLRGEVIFNLTEQGALVFSGEREHHYFYTKLPGKRDCEQQLISQAARLYLEEKLPEVGKRLIGWKNERELRGEAIQKMQLKLGQRGLVRFGKLGGIPDGEAVILEEATGEITTVVIEIDGQYFGRQFEQKVKEIAGFGKSGLWVTTSLHRAERVVQALAKVAQARNPVEVLALKEL